LRINDKEQASRCQIGARIAEGKVPAPMQNLVSFYVSADRSSYPTLKTD
jgi:hypothetical protein